MATMNEMKPITLNDLIIRLNNCSNDFLTIIGEIIQADHGNLYKADLFVLPLLNRSIKLLEGFLLLTKEKNYLCAIPLIRLQLDNSLRFHAANLVSKPQEVFDAFLNGKPINQLKTKSGQRLSDGFLASSLNKLFPGVKKLYTDTSGYVHLSDKHFYSTIIRKPDDQGRMSFGGGADHFTYEEEVNITYQMVNCSELVLTVVDSWKNFKKNMLHYQQTKR